MYKLIYLTVTPGDEHNPYICEHQSLNDSSKPRNQDFRKLWRGPGFQFWQHFKNMLSALWFKQSTLWPQVIQLSIPGLWPLNFGRKGEGLELFCWDTVSEDISYIGILKFQSTWLKLGRRPLLRRSNVLVPEEGREGVSRVDQINVPWNRIQVHLAEMEGWVKMLDERQRERVKLEGRLVYLMRMQVS